MKKLLHFQLEHKILIRYLLNNPTSVSIFYKGNVEYIIKLSPNQNVYNEIPKIVFQTFKKLISKILKVILKQCNKYSYV